MGKKRQIKDKYSKIPIQKKYELIKSIQSHDSTLKSVNLVLFRCPRIYKSITPQSKILPISSEITNLKTFLLSIKSNKSTPRRIPKLYLKLPKVYLKQLLTDHVAYLKKYRNS